MDVVADGVTRVIANYRPRAVSGPAGAFARLSVARSTPLSVNRAKVLLFCASRLASFGEATGLDLVPEVLLHPSVIERFCSPRVTDMASATRRSMRSNLRYLAHELGVAPPVKAATFSRERVKPPYGPAELAAYLALVDAQPTEARAMRGSALIALGAGAGLSGADFRFVRGTDVIERGGAVVVEVLGPRARVVPVRAEFSDRALTAARFRGRSLLVGGDSTARRNVTSGLTRALGTTTDLAPLDLSRLRSTWLCACAADLGLATFLTAAGITCSQRLGDLVAGLSPGTEAQAVALLGGQR